MRLFEIFYILKIQKRIVSEETIRGNMVSVSANLLCSAASPSHFNLLASCCAFFLRRQALEANLFFSLRLLHLAPKGISLTGVKSLIILLNWSSSLPIAANFLGLDVKSFPSPLLAFPLNKQEKEKKMQLNVNC